MSSSKDVDGVFSIDKAIATEAGPNPNLDPISSRTARKNQSLVAEAQAEASSSTPHLHKVTPLIYSDILSASTGHNVYLKLDCLQPSGSFKIRGVGASIVAAHKRYGNDAHIISSSGGNAGLAAATACTLLNAQSGSTLRCSIYVPSTTEQAVMATLVRLGANVHIAGDAWDGADAAARKAVAAEEGAVYIHPFEGEELIQGHSSIMHEIYEQLPKDTALDVLSAAVGGAGFINGILHGITEYAQRLPSTSTYKPPFILAVQDIGADSFTQSINLFLSNPSGSIDDQHVILPAITSKATSMGAKICSRNALLSARNYAIHGHVTPPSENKTIPKHMATLMLSDSLSASACWQFNRDHKMMVELSCGAALAPVYHHERLLQPALTKLPDERKDRKLNIVVIVCGGSKVDTEMLEQYKAEFADMKGTGEARLNGEDI
ncbi:catabolic L-serine/threonine dehydratase [Cystobasidiomycetes sp. EMM_F5]